MGSGAVKNITIKNDKGRLSQAEIDRMLSEAEKYQEEDEKQRQRIAARSNLEGYVFNVKQAVEQAGSKLENTDKNRALECCSETIKWLDNNTTAEKDEFEHKMEEATRTCSPNMTKIHTGAGGGQQQQQRANDCANGSGPTVEEVD